MNNRGGAADRELLGVPTDRRESRECGAAECEFCALLGIEWDEQFGVDLKEIDAL